MSSRLMPPNVGAMAFTVATISSGSLVSRQSGNASTPPNSLNSIALPSMTGIAASGPMSPSPSTALPSETTATVLRLIVYWKALSRSCAIALQTRATPGRVGHREVVAGAQRMLVALLDLAADVHQERAVGGVDHLGAVDRADGVGDRRSTWSVAGRVDGHVAQRVEVVDRDQVDRADRPARLADRGRDAAEHARPVVDPHAQDEGELGGSGHRPAHVSRAANVNCAGCGGGKPSDGAPGIAECRVSRPQPDEVDARGLVAELGEALGLGLALRVALGAALFVAVATLAVAVDVHDPDG